MITIKTYGFPQLIAKLKRLQGDFDGIAVQPALRELHQKFQNTLQATFGSPGGPGQPYKHMYTGTTMANFTHRLGKNYLEEIQSKEKPAEWLRSGTAGQAPPVKVPYGVVEWAMRKLAVPENEAWAIARSIAYGGIGQGRSPLVMEYPIGERRFNFPEWMVAVKNKYDLERAARRIGELTVSYLE